MQYQLEMIANYQDTVNSKTHFTQSEIVEIGCPLCRHNAGPQNSCSFRDKCIAWCPWFSPKDGIAVEKIEFTF